VSTFSDIRAGLAANIGAISGLRTYSFIPDVINPPVAIAGPASVEYDAAFNRGHDNLLWDVIVIVSRDSERAAQDALDTYCDATAATGIKTAVESDPTLGGTVINARVTDMTSYQSLAVGETQYLAATFRISILAN
jgi:hypothetical protein